MTLPKPMRGRMPIPMGSPDKTWRAAPDGVPGDYEFDDSQFFVRMFKHEFDPQAPWKRTQDFVDMAIVLTSEGWGSSDEKLGGTLLSDFLVTLVERREKPRFVFLLHAAVKLSAGGPCLENLKQLEALGVRILLNKTSVMHYKLEKEFRVGEVSTMLDIVGWIYKVGKVVSL